MSTKHRHLQEPLVSLYNTGLIFLQGLNFERDSANLHGYIRRCNSVKVEGGWWVLYERNNFTGYQYVIGPGKYNNYGSWMGFNDCVRSCRIIRNVSLCLEVISRKTQNVNILTVLQKQKAQTNPHIWKARNIKLIPNYPLQIGIESLKKNSPALLHSWSHKLCCKQTQQMI
uniref:Crystallin, gamma S4 n=1 Tax=Neolamprologus brichardi TaxID=32507 RepID=A0A3Q4HPP6_NEOBR